MKQNIKVGIKGKYIFRDSKGNITRVVDNLVTDWGFKRLVGYGDHWCYNFWMNMRYVFFGEQTATELPTDYELANYFIPNNWKTQGSHFATPVPITGTPTFFLKHISINPQPPSAVVPWHPNLWSPLDWENSQWTNSAGKYWWPPKMVWEGGNYDATKTNKYSPYPELVGVTYREDPLTGNIVVRFANTWNLTFNAATTIGEMGVGPVPLNQTDDVIVRCGGTEPWSEDQPQSPYHPSEPVLPGEPDRIEHQNNIKQSLFSRATMNPQAFFNAGDSTTVTYLCDVVLCKEIDLSSDMPFEMAPGSVSTDALPPNKTGMRQVPFFKLPGNNKITNFANKWIVRGPVTLRSAEDNLEAVAIPLLDNQATPSNRGVWALDTFKYTLPVYSSIAPTLTADHQSYNVAGFGPKAIANPINTTFEKNEDATLPNNPVSYVKRYWPFAPVKVVPVAGSGPGGSENTYVTTISFVLPTNHWIVGGTGGGEEMNSFCLWRPINRNHFVGMPSRVQTGYHTFLDGLYTPTANKFIKLTYQIIWNRQ